MCKKIIFFEKVIFFINRFFSGNFKKKSASVLYLKIYIYK
ncbi:hypothetical protein CAter282_4589 [Collimonas arenae]|uniref:Uncharacterized protein n=1 Tax=Collimonas arenae TaxID=279058 RepID=A0A127PX13_9BURK|nr:hypothetical protein CAter10_4995 [Collimonas arenae]AMP12246.1 hypothetical protein CAter282_4589 [Collimonas arenae]